MFGHCIRGLPSGKHRAHLDNTELYDSTARFSMGHRHAHERGKRSVPNNEVERVKVKSWKNLAGFLYSLF